MVCTLLREAENVPPRPEQQAGSLHQEGSDRRAGDARKDQLKLETRSPCKEEHSGICRRSRLKHLGTRGLSPAFPEHRIPSETVLQLKGRHRSLPAGENSALRKLLTDIKIFVLSGKKVPRALHYHTIIPAGDPAVISRIGAVILTDGAWL
jgi:hypothetical protein